MPATSPRKQIECRQPMHERTRCYNSFPCSTGLLGDAAVRAYLILTGTLFGLLAALHVWRMIAEWNGLRAEFWIVAGGSVLAGVLSIWAWRLLAKAKLERHL
jgi:hypothetical protein